MPDRIRLIHLETRVVSWHSLHNIRWDKIWTITHTWDRGEEITIPLKGVNWRSASFSSEDRFKIVLEKTRQIVEARGGEYIWADAACVHQESDSELKEQMPLMATIYANSAGTVVFGTLSPENRFTQIIYTYDDGRKAWVCDWFERMWTLQELQLPAVLLFVSGDHILTRNEVYLSILMMSPYLTSPCQSSPPHLNDPHLSIHDVLNALSPMSKFNTLRALMQTCKRGCSSRRVHDKIYSIIGVVAQGRYSKLKVDYDITIEQLVLNFMKAMIPNDVIDTLVFNTLPPANDIHDGLCWSGMVMLDQLMEHPSYETDIYHATNAVVAIDEESQRATTVVYNAPLWKVVVTKSKNIPADDARVRVWPSISVLSRYAKLTDEFSNVERPEEYETTLRRAENSLAANWNVLEPLLKKNACGGRVGEETLSLIQSSPSTVPPIGPANRLGDERLFDQELTVLVCRSKADKSFHYGIVVTPNEDRDGAHTWHKVCTASFSDGCVVADRDHIERKIVIGR